MSACCDSYPNSSHEMGRAYALRGSNDTLAGTQANEIVRQRQEIRGLTAEVARLKAAFWVPLDQHQPEVDRLTTENEILRKDIAGAADTVMKLTALVQAADRVVQAARGVETRNWTGTRLLEALDDFDREAG